MIDEIIRRGCRLQLDVEVLARRRRGVVGYYVSIYDYHPTSQPGYEHPRLFRGNAPSALKWSEEREQFERDKNAGSKEHA